MNFHRTQKRISPIFLTISIVLIFQALSFDPCFAGASRIKNGDSQNLIVNDGRIELDEDTSLEGQLSGSSSRSARYSIVSHPSQGTVILLNKKRGTYRYTPHKDANGSDEFSFKTSKGKKNSTTGTVFITIHPINDAPIANNQSLEIFQDDSVSGTFQASDIDGDLLDYEIVGNGSLGTVTLLDSLSGDFIYHPKPGATGTDFISFNASDGELFSNSAVVTITIKEKSSPAVPGVFVLSQDPYQINENESLLNINVYRMNGTDGNASIDVDILELSAKSGMDYQASSKTTLSFQEGETSKSMSINILNDNLMEGEESFSVSLSNPTNGSSMGNPSDVLGIIIDDDNADPGVEPADYYVATNGNDSNPGTIDNPFATLPKAISLVKPGQLIYIRGGTYKPTEAFWFSNINGLEGQMIKVFAYPGEKPIFDFSLDADPDAGWVLYESSYWHIKGLGIYLTHDVGMRLRNSSSHNIVEDMEFAFNEEAGFYLRSFSSNNLILNNISHHNFDPDRHGEDADGFTAGTDAIDNTFRGNISHSNSDDGFDLWESVNTTLEGNVAYKNGFDLWGEGDQFNGDGNAYKLGRGPGGHTLIRNIGWGNAHGGATYNSASGPIIMYNNTMYDNPSNYYFKNHVHILRNNLSYIGSVSLDSNTDDENNSWNLGIDDPEFVSEDPSSPDFLHLSPGSPAVDAGVDIGLPFNGSAPDLGAFEF